MTIGPDNSPHTTRRILLSTMLVAVVPLALSAILGPSGLAMVCVFSLAVALTVGLLLARDVGRAARDEGPTPAQAMQELTQAIGRIEALRDAHTSLDTPSPEEVPPSPIPTTEPQADAGPAPRDAVLQKELVSRIDQAPSSIEVLRRVDDMLGRIKSTTESIDDIAGEADLRLLDDAVELVRADIDAREPDADGLSERLVDVCDALGRADEAILTEMGRLSEQVARARQAMRQQIRFEGTGVLEPLYLADMVDEAVRINRCELEKSQVRVRRDYEDLPPVILDKLKVMHILINLVKHAADDLATSEADDPQMELTLSFDDDAHIRVRIVDNGAGFDGAPEEDTTAFVDRARSADYPFGFEQCCKLASDMGGQVKATSPGVGQGATFILEFPCRPLRKKSD